MDAQRDWSHSFDTAEAMYKIITAPVADDFVVASGETHSVKEFAEIVFTKLGMDYEQYIVFDPIYLRPTEVDILLGDSSKIRNNLGWQPKYTFDQLVDEMVEHDLEMARQEKLLKDHIK